jgi:hypothetical protein
MPGELRDRALLISSLGQASDLCTLARVTGLFLFEVKMSEMRQLRKENRQLKKNRRRRRKRATQRTAS